MPELLYVPRLWLWLVGLVCLAIGFYLDYCERWWGQFYRTNVDDVALRSKGLRNVRWFDFLSFFAYAAGAAMFFTLL